MKEKKRTKGINSLFFFKWESYQIVFSPGFNVETPLTRSHRHPEIYPPSDGQKKNTHTVCISIFCAFRNIKAYTPREVSHISMHTEVQGSNRE